MSKKILSSTGKRIRALRNEKGWNQTEFVEILSGNGNQIARSSMSEIETDVNNPSLGLLVGIAKTLGTTADYLLLVNDVNSRVKILRIHCLLPNKKTDSKTQIVKRGLNSISYKKLMKISIDKCWGGVNRIGESG